MCALRRPGGHAAHLAICTRAPPQMDNQFAPCLVDLCACDTRLLLHPVGRTRLAVQMQYTEQVAGLCISDAPIRMVMVDSIITLFR
jgi:hypothetical protein